MNILGIESKEESHWSNSNSSNMKKQRLAHVIETLISSPVAYPDERAPKRILQDPSAASASAYKVDRMKKIGRKEDNLASGIREHVKLGPKITETVKGKLSLGAKIIRAGGVEKIFKHNFSIREGEKLLKASQCYLSTTAGPIAGLLFISTDKVAFFSDRSIKLSSPTGEFIRIHYKVMIPLVKIKRANESQNMKRPSQKYIEMVTVDNFDFWFMGFLNYRGTFKHFQQALSQAQYLQLDQKYMVSRIILHISLASYTSDSGRAQSEGETDSFKFKRFIKLAYMKNLLMEHVIGIPVSSVNYSVQKSPKDFYAILIADTTFPLQMDLSNSKRVKKADHLANGIQDHMRLESNILETVKGKLRLGMKILKVGGMEKIFKQNFNIREGEKLLKALQCYLSTTTGPIAGLLFISTDKVAFFNERSIKLSSSSFDPTCKDKESQ
ncbi:unnamed protein product [Camellia sinensis]